MDALHELQAIIEEQLLVLDGKSDKTDRGGTGELSMVWGEQSTVGGHASSFRCNRGAVSEIHRTMLLSGGSEGRVGAVEARRGGAEGTFWWCLWCSTVGPTLNWWWLGEELKLLIL